MSAFRGYVVAGLAMLSACATLRIDVDVYKGPLANDVEIQIRELTSLAIGSKPLLIEVRDLLETRVRATTRTEWRNRSDYRAGEMNVRGADTERTFRSPPAELANGILGLFRDVDEESEFFTERRDLRRLVDSYRSYYEVINSLRDQGRIDCSLNERVLEARHSMPATLAYPARELMRSVTRYLIPADDSDHFRDSSAILHRLAEFDPSTEVLWITDRLGESGQVGERVDLRKTLKDGSDWSTVGANVCYTILARPDTWDRIVEVVPAEESELREELRRRGVAIARSFLESRRLLRDIMLGAAALAKRASARQSSVVAGENIAESALVLSAACISRSTLSVFTSYAKSWDISVETESLRLLLLEPDVSELMFSRATPGIASTRRLVGLLLDLIVQRNSMLRGAAIRRVAAAIEEVDRWCFDAAPKAESHQEQTTDRESVAFTRDLLVNGSGRGPARALRFVFGLASGPAMSNPYPGAIFTNSEELVRGFANIGDSHGLEGGREPRGIDSLTTSYLVANGDEREHLQRNLVTAIIQFAVKIRLLSGMQPLVGSEGDQQSYVDVLQAIANSIITQADALQRETGLLDSITESDLRRAINLAETALEKTARRDAALQLLGATDPAKRSAVAGELDAGRTLFLSKDDEAKLESPRAVMTELSRRLRYAIAGETAWDKDSPKLQDLRAALEFVEEQLTQTVYLRAAAAYLRNSYPAPDLQNDPLYLQGRILTGDSGALTTSRRKVAERLDKQYWQNVNSIELGGVGQTNYAVIKDDIGNWQIKSYDADTSKLVHTLASMARLATSAGVSAAAVAGAAELQKLLGKVRKGDTLTEEQKKRLDSIEEERATSGAESMATQSAIRSATQRATEINAELRAWTGGYLIDTTIKKLALDAASDEAKKLGDAIRAAIPSSSEPPAGATELAKFEYTGVEFGALCLALAQKIPDALTDATQKAAVVEAARSRLADARTRRLDLLRGLELALLDEPEPEPASAGH